MQLTPGAVLGPYRLEALIARGGMGAVYRATRNDGALVALKVLSGAGRRAEQILRFEREAELTARLAHPAIVRVHGAGSAPGVHYIAMDLIVGEPLSARCGRIPPLEAARLVSQVARAIEHAHERGVLHRDIKPSNVLVRREDDQALITDFGIARALEDASALTRTGALIGTPLYMAPEQATGKPATAATDVHGLGILLYEALTGSPPFEQPDLAAVLVALTSSNATPPSGLRTGTPRELDRLCLAALAKDPTRRPTAGAFAAALEDVVAGRTAARRSRGPALALLLGGVTAATVVAVGVMLRAPAPTAPLSGPTERPSSSTIAPSSTSNAPSGDPPWLRPLLAGGDLAALRAAGDALRGDALAALDASLRTRAVSALERLDAEWRDPRAPGQVMIPEEARAPMRVAFERLILIHALWTRLVPGHALPQVRRGAIDDLIFQGAIGRENGPQVVRTLVEVAPDDLQANILYAQTGNANALDEATLRHGLSVADAAQDEAAWAQIVISLAQLLRVRVESGADVTARQADLAVFDALVEQVLLREKTQPVLASRVLHLAATLALSDQRYQAALDALDRALPMSEAPWEIRRARLTAHAEALRATGAEPHRVGVIADYDALLELAKERADAHVSLALSAADMVDFFMRESWTDPALAVVERALEVVPPLTGAECALLRVLLVARTVPLGEDRLASVLQDFVTRTEGRRHELETTFKVDRSVLQTLDALIVAARDVATRLRRGTITRETLAQTLEQLPGRLYLRPTYPG